MWYQSNQESLKDANLAKCMEALVVKFKKESSIQLLSKSAMQDAPQLFVEYYKCTICSASFSSISRLLNHNQKATCGKSSCKHCEEVFDSKNKLHDHVRNKECQQSPTKSKLANKTGLMPLSTSETIFNDADTAIKKGGIKPNTRPAATSSSAAKSIAPHKSSVSALTHVENTPPKISATPPTTPPPIYRAVSPPPPTYQTITPKTYLTIADLYMRYAPIKSAHSRPTTTRTMSVLPTMSIQDLYKQFGKEKSIISTPNKTLDSSTNRNATSDCQKSHFECSDSTVKTTLSITTKSNIQTSTTQSSSHMRPSKHSTRVVICIDDVRRHTMSTVDLAVADQDACTISYI